ncbi:MAG: phenylacetic acid degradation protein [Desulfovibrionales bacterium]|nr:phenylacetic acid degradation protein [Desulfovibrionales bacterium]
MLYEFDGQRPTVGEGTYVSELADVIGDVRIGRNCYIGHRAVLRGDYGRIEIGDETAVEEGVVIHSPPQEVCSIGRRTTMGHGAIIHAKVMKDNCVIGMGAVVSLWAEIGEWAIVAEGSVVKLRDVVPDRVMVAGAPAKVIRPLEPKDEEMWNWGKQLYIDLAARYLRCGGLKPLK